MARTLLLFGICTLALAQAPPSPVPVSPAVDWRFAHPDAGMKMSLNLQAILNSPVIAKAIQQSKSQAKNNAMQIELVLAMLKTVDRISLSVRQKAAHVGKAAADMDVLVQLTGAFDPQLIAGFFPSAGSAKVKVVGPHTLLIGDGDSFTRAAERIAAGAPAPAGPMEQSDIWLSASPSFLAQQASGVNQPLPPLFQSLREVSMGLNLGDVSEINMLLNAADSTSATEILKTFQDAIGQMALANPMAGTAAKALIMRQDGSTVRLHFVVPPELMALGQQLALQQAASGGLPAQLMPLLGTFGLGGPASSGKPPTSAIAPEPPPQNGGKIVIYGLDDGPKELPVRK